MIISASALTAEAQVCSPAPVGLISWWAADGTTLDSRSRNNGTLQNGATFAAGQTGQAFDFDGLDDFFGVTDDSAFNPSGSFTIEAWVNPDGNVAGSTPIISKWNDSGGNTNTTFALTLENPSKIRFSVVGNNGGFVGRESTAPIPTNTYTHVAAVFDAQAQTLRLFIGGVQDGIAQTTNFNALRPSSVPFLIGAGSFGGGGRRFFNGKVDEPSFYNRALTDEEITLIVNAGQAGKCKPTATLAPSGQVAWLAGDGDARDIAGTNDGTLQNGTGFAVSKVGQGFTFDGVNDFIQLPNNPSFNLSSITVESWINPQAAAVDSGYVFSSRDPFSSEGFSVVVSNNGALGVVIRVVGNPDISPSSFESAPNVIQFGQFQHIAITYDENGAGTLAAFVNGVIVPLTGTAQLGGAIRPSSNHFIGRRQNAATSEEIPGAKYYKGLIDEISIYNRALTETEITSIVNAGIAGKLKQTTTVNTNSSISLWQGEGNANDARGANNGTFPANSYATGRVGQAFQINGGIVSVPDSASLDFTDAYTIEMWFAPAAVGTAGGFSFLACKGDCALANNQPYSMGFLDDRKVYLTVGNNSTIDRLISNSTLPLNSFSHVAGTYDGTTMRIYINGVLDNSKTTVRSERSSTAAVRSSSAAAINSAIRRGFMMKSRFITAL